MKYIDKGDKYELNESYTMHKRGWFYTNLLVEYFKKKISSKIYMFVDKQI